MSIPLFGLAALTVSLPFHDACLKRVSPKNCDRLRRLLTGIVFAMGVYGTMHSKTLDLILAHILITILALSLILVKHHANLGRILPKFCTRARTEIRVRRA